MHDDEKKKKTDRELFAQACLEAMLTSIDEELEAHKDMKLNPSLKHRRRMRYILKHGELPPEISTKKKVLIAILISAILLLTACAVIYGKQILNFCVRTYQDYVAMSQENIAVQSVADMELYSLGYVPEGYVFEKQTRNATTIYHTWVNQERESIIFIQYTGKLNSQTNNDNYTPNETTINGIPMIYLSDGQYNSYYWASNGINFTLRTRIDLPQEDLVKIMQGVHLQ